MLCYRFHKRLRVSESPGRPRDSAVTSRRELHGGEARTWHSDVNDWSPRECRSPDGVTSGMPAFDAFSRAYGVLTASSSSSLPPASASGIGLPDELSVESVVSLAALVATIRSEGARFLHLGSGTGRAVVAWALLFPHSVVSGVEVCSALHRAAVAARTQLDPAVQRRVHLHHCDTLIPSSWCQVADVILVSAESFDDSALNRLAEGLCSAAVGTNVFMLSRPLCRPVPGFNLAQQAVCRTTAARNVVAFVYRRSSV